MKLSVDKLHFKYDKTEILKGISFEVESGDLLCILGPNGSGKTTLFKCILGFLNPHKGEVSINNENIRNIKRPDLAKKIAYIPQAHIPSFNYTVLDVVLMGRVSYVGTFSSLQDSDYDIAIEALEKLRILHLIDKGYGEISGGERQLVLIARAITQNSRILIMDEPTANLDYGNQVTVLKEVKKLSEEGYIIIMSSHNPDHAFLYSNKVLMMKKGEVVSIGSPNEVVDENKLSTLYSVDMELINIKNGHKICVPKI